MLIVSLYPSLLFAQGLLITDCQGFTRVAKALNPGKAAKLEVSVSNAGGTSTNGVQVSLTNSATGEVSTAVAKNGVAVFDNVTRGVFTLSTEASGVSIGSVSVAGASVSAGVATGVGIGTVIGGGGAVVAGGTEVVDTTFGDSSNDSTDINNGDEDVPGFENDPSQPTDELPDPNLDGANDDFSGDDPGGDDNGKIDPGDEDPTDEDPVDEPCDDCDPDNKPESPEEDDFFPENPELSPAS